MLQKINLSSFRDFFRSASAGGIVLIICVGLALVIANSPYASILKSLLEYKIGFNIAEINLKYTVLLWINDGLMAVFFLYVGLEIKRELAEGELSSPKQAALPVLAALGGVLVPALIYYLFNQGSTDTAKGWGIPMATDIAFAIGIISLLGNSVPGSLKVFLAALAIVDDLMAILVIAFFYSTHVHLMYLVYAAGTLILLIIFNSTGVKHLLFYLIPGAFMWYFIHHSGVHATISGVLTALVIPSNKWNKPSSLERLEHSLDIPVSFFILPLFAFVNTNIRFEPGMEEGLLSTMGLGIICGLFFGKPMGIFFASLLAVKSGFCRLPSAATWKHMLGVGMLGGIGFTMSIFIAILSFQDSMLQAESKFCILIASLLSGLSGYCFLKSQKVKTLNKIKR